MKTTVYKFSAESDWGAPITVWYSDGAVARHVYESSLRDGLRSCQLDEVEISLPTTAGEYVDALNAEASRR